MTTKRKKKTLDKSLFFLTFIGEYVQIKLDLSSKMHAESNEGLVTEEGPLTLQGYLLDMDKNFYYLGGSPGSVTDAVKKIAVKHIRIVPVEQPKTIFDDILDSAIPGQGDFN